MNNVLCVKNPLAWVHSIQSDWKQPGSQVLMHGTRNRMLTMIKIQPTSCTVVFILLFHQYWWHAIFDVHIHGHLRGIPSWTSDEEISFFTHSHPSQQHNSIGSRYRPNCLPRSLEENLICVECQQLIRVRIWVKIYLLSTSSAAVAMWAIEIVSYEECF